MPRAAPIMLAGASADGTESGCCIAFQSGPSTAIRVIVATFHYIDIIDSIGYNGHMTNPSEIPQQASLNIRQLDPALKEQLRIRAAHHGRSMEAEARAILKEALTKGRPTTGADLVAAIRSRFAPLGGVELELPRRGPGREAPQFE
jgi:plasmid stability protein